MCYFLVQENRFAKCDTCTMLKEEKEKTTDMKKKKELQIHLDAHLALQRYIISLYVYVQEIRICVPFNSQERKHYYTHRDLGQRNKQECMSIIIDGMDQSKTNLPHLVRQRKSGCNLWKLR